MQVRVRLVAMAVFATGVTLGAASQATAGLIYDSTVLLSGQGFGAAPRDLTIHATGPDKSPESGCVSPTGGFTVGSAGCMGADADLGNGFVNVGGAEANPHADNQKFGAPFASERGITSAADIGILLNATEPAGDGITIDDLTLKFYFNGTLVGSIDGKQSFGSTEPGNGKAGFVFRVDDDQSAYVDSILAMGDIQFALESTLSGNGGGPESYRIVSLGSGGAGQTVPEPTSVVLFGLAALAAARRSRPVA